MSSVTILCLHRVDKVAREGLPVEFSVVVVAAAAGTGLAEGQDKRTCTWFARMSDSFYGGQDSRSYPTQCTDRLCHI